MILGDSGENLDDAITEEGKMLVKLLLPGRGWSRAAARDRG